ncbi:MAG: hypothetical protein Q6L50_05860 [Gloeomargarita sp. GMQP_bins_120]
MRESWQPQQTLVRQTPTYLELHFGDSPVTIPESQQLRRLKVGYCFLTPQTARWEEGDVRLHDVPLQ